MPSSVVYQDLGLKTLSQDAERLLEQVVAKAARDVEAQMKANIVDRGFFDTGATTNSVQVDPPTAALERDIGPTTHYAIYGEMGYIQTQAWGHDMATPVHHPALHFARDALTSVQHSFEAAVAAAMKKLGRG